MVDWGLARQVARFAANYSPGGPSPSVDLGVDLEQLVAGFEGEVAAYTRLDAGPVPTPRGVGRAEWAEANLEQLGALLDPVAERLDRRMDSAGPLAGALRAGAGATLAAEAGLVMGYISQRVLGQYELSLLGPEAPPRLLFVTPNLERAVSTLEVDRESFLGWVAIHELTHVFQFQGVPWLRDHLGGLLRRYLATVDVRIDRGAAGGLPSLPDFGRLVERFREGGLAALVQTGEQRALMSEVSATMAVVEGHSEHVMDALGEKLLPEWDGLREAMTLRRESRSAPERVIHKLLGLDVKMRQYEVGKAFCDAVVSREGIEALNRVWEGPERLPSESELARPEAWLDRVGPAPTPA